MSVPRKTVEVGDTVKAGEVVKTEADIEAELRVKIAAEYEARFAALEARLSQPVNTVVNNPPKPQNNHMLGFDPNAEIVQDGPKQLVHFVDDGFTVGQTVYYRGQEAELPEADILSDREQILKYRTVYYRVGPWNGSGYDLSDPNLTEADRLKLQSLMASR